MLKVTFILCEHMLATSLSLPMEQLRAAEDFARASRRQKGKQLQLCLASVGAKSVRSHTGIPMQADCDIQDVDQTSVIYLPSIWRNPRPVIAQNLPLLNWLKTQNQQGSLIAGVGTGCYLLADAGLLDGKPGTTHWHFFDDFKKHYPQVDLKQQYFITQAKNIYCAGSINALADLTVHFIQRFFSHSAASHVEQHFFHEIRRGYEEPSALHDPVNSHPDESIIQTQMWLNDHHQQAISIDNLAEKFDMSTRTLNRRFKRATGVTPKKYLQKIRMEAAKDLLKNTNLSLGEVMEKVGYHDQAHFSTLFKRHHATTPGQYRTTVRQKLFTVD